MEQEIKFTLELELETTLNGTGGTRGTNYPVPPFVPINRQPQRHWDKVQGKS